MIKEEAVEAVTTALATLHAAACRVDEVILAARAGCDCPVLHLGELTTEAEIFAWVGRLLPFAGDLPCAVDDPVEVSFWLERSLLALGYRPGAGRFPAVHSHTELPVGAIRAIRKKPDDEALLARLAAEHGVGPLEVLSAALPDAPDWKPRRQSR